MSHFCGKFIDEEDFTTNLEYNAVLTLILECFQDFNNKRGVDTERTTKLSKMLSQIHQNANKKKVCVLTPYPRYPYSHSHSHTLTHSLTPSLLLSPPPKSYYLTRTFDHYVHSYVLNPYTPYPHSHSPSHSHSHSHTLTHSLTPPISSPPIK